MTYSPILNSQIASAADILDSNSVMKNYYTNYEDLAKDTGWIVIKSGVGPILSPVNTTRAFLIMIGGGGGGGGSAILAGAGGGGSGCVFASIISAGSLVNYSYSIGVAGTGGTAGAGTNDGSNGLDGGSTIWNTGGLEAKGGGGGKGGIYLGTDPNSGKGGFNEFGSFQLQGGRGGRALKSAKEGSKHPGIVSGTQGDHGGGFITQTGGGGAPCGLPFRATSLIGDLGDGGDGAEQGFAAANSTGNGSGGGGGGNVGGAGRLGMIFVKWL